MGPNSCVTNIFLSVCEVADVFIMKGCVLSIIEQE